MGTIEKDRILQMRGEDLYHSDGDKIGSIEEIYVDQETDAPEWALVSKREEADLYRHYGLGSREPASGRDVSGPTTDDAMTRSEEELSVGTTERESGRVRLRKYVVTDEVTKTVPVKREEIEVDDGGRPADRA